MPANSQPLGGLDPYRAKRSAGRTPEPFGGERSRVAGPGLFVVQKHAARRLHYDVRLELGGVLVSWAVPKGPSLDPAEKRLAVHVEDHPLEYADFEGAIPEGNYGAGAVIVWDRGRWVPVEDPAQGLERGKLLFDLFGYKLRGRFTLVRTGKRGVPSKEWLLIKKPDAFADPGGRRPPSEQSILSGLTVEEMQRGAERAAQVRADVDALGAPARSIDPRRVNLMLCETRLRPFSDPGWIFELKYDGYRLLAAARDGRPLLRYRSGLVVDDRFPDIAQAVAALPYRSLILDGEVVCIDETGRPDFHLLQRRSQLARARDVRRAAVENPATLMAFDLLELEGRDVRGLPLSRRKQLLRRVLPAEGPLRYADHVEARGEALFAEVAARGLEGVVGKEAAAPYRGGRSPSWLKIPRERTDDFAVIGYAAPKGSRGGFGSLHLAVRAPEGADARWLYAGKVGSGFAERDLAEIRAALDRLPPLAEEVAGAPAGAGDRWVAPVLVAQVRYKEWRQGRLLRQPRFVALREDKPADECEAPRWHGDAPPRQPGGPRPRPPSAQEPAVSSGRRALALTNLDKLFWPEQGYTKGDLIHYYRSVSRWLLPYLADRPLVLTRYPDGIAGKSFFQKDAPKWVPDWIRTETMWSEHAGREIHYFVCEDEDTLIYLVNLGTIPLHIWSSRISSLARPDFCILDLDPKGAPFEGVVLCAQAIHRLATGIGLDSFVKTSGQAGLHVLIPLGGRCTFEQSRALAELIARIVEAELPDVATTARALRRRGGRIYLDFLQNGHGRLIAAPLSVRPQPAATVSTPLRWREVTRRLDPSRFTIESVPRRMARLKNEPMRPVLEARPDLGAALARLGEVYGRVGARKRPS